ncbi:MAG: DNA-3-methyladenine glycosylase 2 family protein [Lachnospiraceae bacterium]|jgi:N-glycosylase/DNA lyase|nr:DNA-3-methyladenine glycosylase 2 family protein [Lachnospiraceae bacterium]
MIIEIKDDFDLKKIADSGQCFRWQPIENDGYRIIHRDKCLCIYKKGEHSYELDCTEDEYLSVWSTYLDLTEDYESIRKRIDKVSDPFLYEAAEHELGIRILRQDPWEALISFIISQNRNIPAIKASIEKLCEKAGVCQEDKRGEVYYTFPTPQAIADMNEEDMAYCKLGYRDKYIMRFAKSVVDKTIDLNGLNVGTDDEVLKGLTGIYGVGKKVASCMLLFGFHRLDAFPIDVWIKRVLESEYNNQYPFELYSPYNGVYQQYMFAYYRNKQ